jgi:geranylgeranyl diphosphate synthase, type II
MLSHLLHDYSERVTDKLQYCLPSAHIHPTRLHQAMRYAVLNGGKRLRPALVYLSGSALDVPLSHLDAPACAVELIHAYSLVHDDLPSMDDDDLRRGLPTCHKAFDEALAILAGDALQTLAFQVLAQAPALTPQQRLAMVETLALAAGSRGMVGGQAIDIDAVGTHLNLAELEDMHIHKTGMLIRASVTLGALSQSTVDDDILQRLDHYAKCIGLAFQIQDDILDVEGETAILGKACGHDRDHDKPTYPALLGLADSRQMAHDLLAQALAALDGFGIGFDPLRWIARYIVTRNH